MIIPAFIDSHMHVLGLGFYNEILNLNQANSIKEVLNTIKNNYEYEIVIGRGWNQDRFIEQAMISKDDLDVFDKPIVLYRICGHVAVVNQAMLEVLGINEYTEQVFGGSFDLKTGIFSENALGLISANLPKPTKEDLKRYLVKANNLLLENGITKVASDDFSSFNVDFKTVIDAINEVDNEGLLDVEITEQVNLPYDVLVDFINQGYANKRFKNFKLGPLKVLADGSLGGRTASLRKPYSDDLSNSGILTYSDESLQRIVDLANKNNMDSVIHAIGDKAIDQAIAVISNSKVKYPRKNSKHAIIHNQLANLEQIDLMRNHGIGAIIQPIFINTDIKIIEKRLGDRFNETYLFKSMYDHILTGLSTDAPVESVSPFHNIYCAVTRKSIDYPDLKPFIVSEAMSVREAIIAYTTTNLDFVYDQIHDDFIEIDKDIFSADHEEIKNIQVLKTIKNGKVVYDKKN
jgi:hypothetical protein